MIQDNELRNMLTAFEKAAAIGLRSVVVIDYTGMKEIYRVGDAVVYEKRSH